MAEKMAPTKPWSAPQSTVDRRQRALSPYNQFMKINVTKFKRRNPAMPHKEAFRRAALAWGSAPENPKNFSSPKSPVSKLVSIPPIRTLSEPLFESVSSPVDSPSSESRNFRRLPSASELLKPSLLSCISAGKFSKMLNSTRKSPTAHDWRAGHQSHLFSSPSSLPKLLSPLSPNCQTISKTYQLQESDRALPQPQKQLPAPTSLL